MTSVLYSAGLNYQSGNPVRSEIVAIRRDVDSLRKQVDILTEENVIYKKYLTALLKSEDALSAEFKRDMESVVEVKELAAARPPGGATVQGAGFRR